MEIHTFLFDIIKLLSTISMGILSISITFLDKLNLDFSKKIVTYTLVTLWLSLIFTLVFGITAGFFIYTDMEESLRMELFRKWQTKTFTLLTFLSFSIALFSLIKIGTLVIKQKREIKVEAKAMEESNEVEAYD